MTKHHRHPREIRRQYMKSLRLREEYDAVRIDAAQLRMDLLAPKAEAALLEAARLRSIRLHLDRDADRIEAERKRDYRP